MQFKSLIALCCLLVAGVMASPVADALPDAAPMLLPRKPIAEHIISNPLFKRAKKCDVPVQAAANSCSSGSPYCCSGSGSDQVCGPANTVSCASTTICCINTNGMQICAGDIDFTGPVTININAGGKCKKTK